MTIADPKDAVGAASSRETIPREKLDGEPWALFAVMKDDRIVRVVAKSPLKAEAIDVTQEIAELVNETGRR